MSLSRPGDYILPYQSDKVLYNKILSVADEKCPVMRNEAMIVKISFIITTGLARNRSFKEKHLFDQERVSYQQ